MFKTPPCHLAHVQYLPSGIQSILGEATYRNIIQKNNKFLMQGASIPIKGITGMTLEMSISVTININKEDISICDLLLHMSWCSQVEMTETPRKIIIVMTKSQLSAAR